MHFSTLVLSICLMLVIVTGQDREQVCYKEVGCFPTGEPWTSKTRPVPPPQGPDVVKVFFVLYTRKNPVDAFFIYDKTNWSIEGSHYDGQKPTIVFTHGFSDSTNESWVEPTKDSFLKGIDANVILVDYGSIRNQEYVEAVSNARVIAALVSNFLEYLIRSKSASLSRFHLVGFSLGAHISAYVGQRMPGIGRITGLDPAQPLFQGESEEVRLDKRDAIFVDIAHTNGSPTVPLVGLGFISPIGHVDFYFNGGWDQPGCGNDLLGLVINASNAWPQRLLCPHQRSVQYFNEAMANPNCTFWGIKRTGLNALLRIITGGWLSRFLTNLSKCDIETCVPFGLRAIDFPGRGSFDIATADKSPYCINSTQTDRLMRRLLRQYNSSS